MADSARREQLSPEPIVSLDEVSRYFGTVKALERVSLEVAAGETFALLGPNGSGKSTLLRILSGYLKPSGGEIRINGYSLTENRHFALSGISYVPDESELYGRMSVSEFLRFIAGIKCMPKHTVAGRIAAVIQQLELKPVADKKIKVLSRGFRQRVAIAQALLNEPRLILLDEPTNGLDPVQIREWRELMKTLSAQCTVIFTSHVLDDVVALAGRVGLLVAGQLLSVASLTEGTSREALEKIFFDTLSQTAQDS